MSFNDTATTEIYTLSLHDALPISDDLALTARNLHAADRRRLHVVELLPALPLRLAGTARLRSEEHTSELQSHVNLVCRLLLEKKKTSMTHPSSAGARIRKG